jgi:chaperonin GroEL
MLTTECIVSEAPKDESGAGGGGMPDMGGMGM